MSSPLPQGRVRAQRIAEAAVERARLTVVPRMRARSPRVPFVTLVSLLLLAGVVGLLMFNTSMQQNAFAATALEQQATDLNSREQTLAMELEELRDPQRLGERAQAMGMVQGSTPAFISLPDGRVLGTPTPAVLADRINVLPPVAMKPAAQNPKPIVIEVERTKKSRRNTSPTSSVQRGATGRNESSTRNQGDRSAR